MANPIIKTHYFTLGQNHRHIFFLHELDKDCVIKIISTNPYSVMIRCFNDKWSNQYERKPDMSLFPRGIFNLNSVTWETPHLEIPYKINKK